MTKQRQLIMNIVNQSCGHPTAEEIFLAAREAMPGIAFATVYNNLNALTQQKLIRRVLMHDGPDCYDRAAIPHEHMVCDVCGAVQDVTVKDFVAEVERQTGEKITSYELNLHHICGKCREKMAKTRD